MGLTCKLRPWDGWAPRVHSAGAGAHASEGHDHHPGGTHHSGGPAAADAAESPARCCDFSGQSPSTRVISPHTTCSSPTQEGQMPGATRARAGLPWCLSGEESAYQCRRRGVGAPVTGPLGAQVGLCSPRDEESSRDRGLGEAWSLWVHRDACSHICDSTSCPYSWGRGHTPPPLTPNRGQQYTV